jgi:hypothetical protein
MSQDDSNDKISLRVTINKKLFPELFDEISGIGNKNIRAFRLIQLANERLNNTPTKTVSEVSIQLPVASESSIVEPDHKSLEPVVNKPAIEIEDESVTGKPYKIGAADKGDFKSFVR